MSKKITKQIVSRCLRAAIEEIDSGDLIFELESDGDGSELNDMESNVFDDHFKTLVKDVLKFIKDREVTDD